MGRHHIFSSLMVLVALLGLRGSADAAPGVAGMAGWRTGIASWYGQAFEGRRMADGCPFVSDNLSAASRTLRIGAWVRVRRLGTNRSVIVLITDRGPYIRGRIIDLSRAAAEQLDMIAAGLVMVTIEPLSAGTHLPYITSACAHAPSATLKPQP